MVTSTISGTFHHEHNLARVYSFKNISFITSTQTRWFMGYNREGEHHILYFASHAYLPFFFKICRLVICPVRGTYNHVSIFLCSRTKTAFELTSRATFAIAKFSYLFRISQLTRKFQFLSRICQMLRNGDKNISFIRSTQALYSIWVITLNASTISYSLHLIYFDLFSKYVGWFVCPVRGDI